RAPCRTGSRSAARWGRYPALQHRRRFRTDIATVFRDAARPKERMKRSSKSEIRNPKSETPVGSQILLSVLLRISNFGFRILTLALLFLASPALPATNISSSGDDLPKLRPPRAEIPPTFWEKYELWVILGSIALLALIGALVWLLT